ncbi:MAG: RNB domain-containing ribonuclease [Acidimicrobiia bacterium]
MSRIRATAGTAATVAAGLAAIRDEFDVPGEFSKEVLREADAAAAAWREHDRPDRTDLPLVTLDPATATDLDQAFAIEEDGDDLVLRYAIANLGAFVEPGGAMERELWQRGVTVYLPDGKANLHPPVLSEGAASLLPGERRPAVLLTVAVDRDGEVALRSAERVVVKSRAKLAYETVEPRELPEQLRAFAERIRLAEDRRGASRVEFPEQEVTPDPDRPGDYLLRLRPRLPTEDENAALSLAANLAVAAALFDARTGLFRVMDEPDEREVRALRHTARALSVDWPKDMDLRTFQRSLDTADPNAAAFLIAVRRAGGGASYAPFAEGDPPWHAAIAATYVHATAPLRRLADRYVLDAAIAVSAGESVPEYVTTAFGELSEVMSRADSRSSKVDRAAIDLVEAVALHGHEGDVFDAVVVDTDERDGAKVQLHGIAVMARVVKPGSEPGDDLRLQLVSADPAARRVEFLPL